MSEHRRLQDRLAVCSWSLRPDSPASLAGQLNILDLPRTQLALDPVRAAPAWSDAGEVLANEGIRIVSGMFGTVGEDYSSLESIRRTGGIVPDETWDLNWRNIRENARIAGELKIPLVTFHAGFLPDELDTSKAHTLMDRIRRIAEHFGESGMDIAFETGQETPKVLREYLEALALPNLGVNFDPANMLIYGTGEPVASLKLLAPWLKQVHIKDATRSPAHGQLGAEALAGEGDVPWPEFLVALNDLHFDGWLIIEREGGDQRAEDIAVAREVVLTSGSTA